MTKNYEGSETLTDLAQQAIRELVENHETAIVTRGVMIVEILNSDDDSRSVYGVQLGAGEMNPWDVIGLIRVVEIRSEYEIARGVTDE